MSILIGKVLSKFLSFPTRLQIFSLFSTTTKTIFGEKCSNVTSKFLRTKQIFHNKQIMNYSSSPPPSSKINDSTILEEIFFEKNNYSWLQKIFQSKNLKLSFISLSDLVNIQNSNVFLKHNNNNNIKNLSPILFEIPEDYIQNYKKNKINVIIQKEFNKNTNNCNFNKISRCAFVPVLLLDKLDENGSTNLINKGDSEIKEKENNKNITIQLLDISTETKNANFNNNLEINPKNMLELSNETAVVEFQDVEDQIIKNFSKEKNIPFYFETESIDVDSKQELINHNSSIMMLGGNDGKRNFHNNREQIKGISSSSLVQYSTTTGGEGKNGGRGKGTEEKDMTTEKYDESICSPGILFQCYHAVKSTTCEVSKKVPKSEKIEPRTDVQNFKNISEKKETQKIGNKNVCQALLKSITNSKQQHQKEEMEKTLKSKSPFSEKEKTLKIHDKNKNGELKTLTLPKIITEKKQDEKSDSKEERTECNPKIIDKMSEQFSSSQKENLKKPIIGVKVTEVSNFLYSIEMLSRENIQKIMENSTSNQRCITFGGGAGEEKLLLLEVNTPTKVCITSKSEGNEKLDSSKFKSSSNDLKKNSQKQSQSNFNVVEIRTKLDPQEPTVNHTSPKTIDKKQDVKKNSNVFSMPPKVFKKKEEATKVFEKKQQTKQSPSVCSMPRKSSEKKDSSVSSASSEVPEKKKEATRVFEKKQEIKQFPSVCSMPEKTSEKKHDEKKDIQVCSAPLKISDKEKEADKVPEKKQEATKSFSVCSMPRKTSEEKHDEKKDIQVCSAPLKISDNEKEADKVPEKKQEANKSFSVCSMLRKTSEKQYDKKDSGVSSMPQKILEKKKDHKKNFCVSSKPQKTTENRKDEKKDTTHSTLPEITTKEDGNLISKKENIECSTKIAEISEYLSNSKKEDLKKPIIGVKVTEVSNYLYSIEILSKEAVNKIKENGQSNQKCFTLQEGAGEEKLILIEVSAPTKVCITSNNKNPNSSGKGDFVQTNFLSALSIPVLSLFNFSKQKFQSTLHNVTKQLLFNSMNTTTAKVQQSTNKNTISSSGDIINKVVHITGCRELKIIDCPIPKINDYDVLVKVDTCGVTGSDLYMYNTGGKHCNNMLGHEASGVVEKIGKCVTHLQIGDHVAIEPGVCCALCYYCKIGKYNLCPRTIYLGSMETHTVHPGDFCHKLPKSVNMDDGALVHPLALAMHACIKADICPRSRVLVIGSCPMALSTVACAKALGAYQVSIVDIHKKNLEIASTKMCVDHSILVEMKMTVDEICECIIDKTKSYPNTIIIISGCTKSFKIASKCCERGGIIILGGCYDQCASFNILHTLSKEINILSSFRSSNDYQTAINLLSQKRVKPSNFITHCFPLNCVKDAFETALNPNNNPIKVIVKCQDTS